MISSRASLAVLTLGLAGCPQAGPVLAPEAVVVLEDWGPRLEPEQDEGEASLLEPGTAVVVPWATRRLPSNAGFDPLVPRLAPRGLSGPLWLSYDEHGEPFADPGSVTAELPAHHPHARPRRFQPIEDPARALVPFYEALARTDAEQPGAITRVLHLGDSSIGRDTLPHAVRSRLQARFGDGGAGFVLLDRYIRNVDSKLTRIRSNDEWDTCYIRNRCDAEGFYGLGGHVFESEGGAVSWLSPREDEVRRTSRVELWFGAQPGGGELQMRIDEGETVRLSTEADDLVDRWHAARVPPGPHALTVTAAGGGPVRVYGAVLETDGPGVVWDAVSMYGAFTKRLRGYDAEHLARQVRRREPDLLVLSFGGNDLRRLVAGAVDTAGYAREYADVLQRLRADQPSLPCLMIGVIDHGRSGALTVSRAAVRTMIETQREIAKDRGCAFFDSVAAMGGAGSLRRWAKRDPPWAEADLKHLSPEGHEWMGTLIYRALTAGYESYRRGPIPARRSNDEGAPVVDRSPSAR
ncbi:MAG: GDSL-type esterase/lipase family protein [Nannocystaceae bacterium]